MLAFCNPPKNDKRQQNRHIYVGPVAFFVFVLSFNYDESIVPLLLQDVNEAPL